MRIDTHHLGAHGLLRLLVATGLALALLLTLEAGPVATAKSKTCSVRNARTAQTYSRLQPAVRRARPGDKLIVRGICKGGTFVNKRLTIVGKAKGGSRAVLSGAKKDRVLTIKPRVKVNLTKLVVRQGRGRFDARQSGAGGILNRGTLTLRRVTVKRNRYAGVENQGTLRLKQGSVIARSKHQGVLNSGTLILRGSSRISRNGGTWNLTAVRNEGTLILFGASRISANRGGVANWTGATLMLNGRSSIRDNHGPAEACARCPVQHGGGVANYGTLALNANSSIVGNSGYLGGGVYNSGTLALNERSSIAGNSGYFGGGVFNWHALTITGASRITGNAAKVKGGGLYNASGSTLTGVSCAPHTLANVYGNTPDDCYLE